MSRDARSSSVLVTAWVGSRNAGDELVHAGLRRLLADRGIAVSAITRDRTHTAAWHGGAALGRGRACAGLVTGRLAVPLVLGGGGLLQDATSAANLPYHLLPVVAARARRVAVAGIGLGAGPIRSPRAQGLVAAALGGIDVTVRDGPSADVLASLGLARPHVAADLALELDDPVGATRSDVLAVALRPWSAAQRRLPLGRRPDAVLDPRQVARLAAAVDSAAGRLGLGVQFVAFDTAKDHVLHRAVADRLRAAVVGVEAPAPLDALAAIAGARAVVAMRYHAGVAALLGRRPAVLLSYAPKVDALAADVGAGFRALAWDVADAGLVGATLEDAVAQAHDGVLEEAIARLRARGAGNGRALDRLLDRGAAPLTRRPPRLRR